MVIERAGLVALAVVAALVAVCGGIWGYGESRFGAGVRAEAARQAAHIAELNEMIGKINDAATEAYARDVPERVRVVTEVTHDVVVVAPEITRQCDVRAGVRERLNRVGGAP